MQGINFGLNSSECSANKMTSQLLDEISYSMLLSTTLDRNLDVWYKVGIIQRSWILVLELMLLRPWSCYLFLNPCSWIHVPESMFLNLCFWIHVPESFFLNPSSWIHVPESMFLNPCSWIHNLESMFLNPNYWIHVPESMFLNADLKKENFKNEFLCFAYWSLFSLSFAYFPNPWDES